MKKTLVFCILLCLNIINVYGQGKIPNDKIEEFKKNSGFTFAECLNKIGEAQTMIEKEMIASDSTFCNIIEPKIGFQEYFLSKLFDSICLNCIDNLINEYIQSNYTLEEIENINNYRKSSLGKKEERYNDHFRGKYSDIYSASQKNSTPEIDSTYKSAAFHMLKEKKAFDSILIKNNPKFISWIIFDMKSYFNEDDLNGMKAFYKKNYKNIDVTEYLIKKSQSCFTENKNLNVKAILQKHETVLQEYWVLSQYIKSLHKLQTDYYSSKGREDLNLLKNKINKINNAIENANKEIQYTNEHFSILKMYFNEINEFINIDINLYASTDPNSPLVVIYRLNLKSFQQKRKLAKKSNEINDSFNKNLQIIADDYHVFLGNYCFLGKDRMFNDEKLANAYEILLKTYIECLERPEEKAAKQLSDTIQKIRLQLLSISDKDSTVIAFVRGLDHIDSLLKQNVINDIYNECELIHKEYSRIDSIVIDYLLNNESMEKKQAALKEADEISKMSIVKLSQLEKENPNLIKLIIWYKNDIQNKQKYNENILNLNKKDFFIALDKKVDKKGLVDDIPKLLKELNLPISDKYLSNTEQRKKCIFQRRFQVVLAKSISYYIGFINSIERLDYDNAQIALKDLIIYLKEVDNDFSMLNGYVRSDNKDMLKEFNSWVTLLKMLTEDQYPTTIIAIKYIDPKDYTGREDYVKIFDKTMRNAHEKIITLHNNIKASLNKYPKK